REQASGPGEDLRGGVAVWRTWRTTRPAPWGVGPRRVSAVLHVDAVTREARALVRAQRRDVVALDVQDDAAQAPRGQVLDHARGEVPAQPGALGVGVDAEHVQLAVVRTGLDLHPDGRHEPAVALRQQQV